MLVNERITLGDVDELLGRSLKDSIKSIVRKVTNPVKKVVKKVVSVKRDIFKKIAPKRLENFVSRTGKKAKKHFPKYAPYLAAVAQVLNFIPGLGVAVGLAITAGAAAIQIAGVAIEVNEAKKAMDHMEEADVKEIERLDAEALAEERKAKQAAIDAFIAGESYFTEKYGITRAQFEVMELPDMMAFLEKAVTDLSPEAAQRVAAEDAAAAQAESVSVIPPTPGFAPGTVPYEQYPTTAPAPTHINYSKPASNLVSTREATPELILKAYAPDTKPVQSEPTPVAPSNLTMVIALSGAALLGVGILFYVLKKRK